MDVEKITSGWLKEKFGWAVSQQDKVNTLELANGLMGRIYRVECGGQGFVYKIPPNGTSGWQQVYKDAGLMNREVQAYNFLYKNHPEIGKNIAPACYWAESGLDGEGALALEDLTESAIKASFYNGLTFDQAAAAIRSFARLHSISATREDDPLSAPYDWVYTARSEQLMEAIKEGICDLPNILNERLPELLQFATLDRLSKVDIEEISVNAHAHSKIVSLCHGDSWSSNILFKTAGEKEIDKALLIDWQFFMWGNPLTDVALLLMSSIDVDKRRQWTEKLLQEYCAELNKNCDIDYNFEDCYADFKLAKDYAALVVFASLETYTNAMKSSEYPALYPRLKGIVEEVQTLVRFLQQSKGQRGYDFP